MNEYESEAKRLADLQASWGLGIEHGMKAEPPGADETAAPEPACDYCAQGDRPVLGWHRLPPDPEGVEGSAAIPCPRYLPR